MTGGDGPEVGSLLHAVVAVRRDGERWLLVHRHADRLLHPISLQQFAALARGSEVRSG